jgi:hypothetical protein
MTSDEEKQLSFNLEAGLKKQPQPQEERQKEGKSLEWVSHPAKRNARVTILVSGFVIILVAIVYFITYSVWFGLLAFVILFGSLLSFYFPTAYRLTEDEIIVKSKMQTLRKKWSQYRTYYPDKNGVLLSPFLRPSRLENFRGFYLRFWYNRDEVIDFVKAQMEKTQAQEDKTT